MNIENKAAVVTGSSRGVGRATALALGTAGCAVAVNYVSSKKEADEVVDQIATAGGRAIAVQGDVSDDAVCRNLMDTAAKEFGRFDILVNNAGTTEFIAHGAMDKVTDEVWDRIMHVNVRGPFQCVRAARPYLEAAGQGEVVNVSSVAGVAAMGSSIPYCASKAALNNMTVSLARTLGPKIRVNAVAPGFIQTEWLVRGLGGNYDAVKAANEHKAVLGKTCTPEDVSDAILAFITGSDLVTGQITVVDGGMLIGPKIS